MMFSLIEPFAYAGIGFVLLLLLLDALLFALNAIVDWMRG